MPQSAILYSGTRNASSWAMRAWLALRAADVSFEEVVVDIRRPQRFPNLAEIADLSPTAAVPVLLVDDRVIFESSAIMEYANDVSGGALLPADPLMRAEARSLVAWQHAGLSGICARISFESAFYPWRRALDETEQAEAAWLFGVLERALSGSPGPGLFGEAGLADFMLTPTVIRLARHEADTDRFPLTREWMARLLRHPLVTEWMAEADRLPHIWFDDYLLPDRPVALSRRSASGALYSGEPAARCDRQVRAPGVRDGRPSSQP